MHYVFKRGASGQGYFRDERPIVSYQPSTKGHVHASKLGSSGMVANAAKARHCSGKGLLGTSKALIDAGMISSGGEDEDEDPVGRPTQGVRWPAKAKAGTRKALPGRLRKKLARDKHAPG